MLTIGSMETHWTLLIDPGLKESAKLATHYGHFGFCPSGHLLFQSWDHTMCILHPTCFLHLLMIGGISQSLKTSWKHHLQWLSTISKPLACPLQRALGNMRLCFLPLLSPRPGETCLTAQQGSCCQWTVFGGQTTEYSLPRNKHLLLYNFKGQSCIVLSYSNVKRRTLRPKTLFAFAELTYAGIICPVA